MTEDIVLNIRAEIDPVSQNIKSLLEAANPDQEATKQALESIKAEYESLQKELQSGTNGIFGNIPKEMDETLSRTISRIRSQVISLKKDIGSLGENLDDEQKNGLYQKTGYLIGNIQTFTNGLKDLQKITKNASPKQLAALSNSYIDIARSINNVAQGLTGRSGIGLQSIDSLYNIYTNAPAERAAFNNFLKHIGAEKQSKEVFSAIARLSLPTTSQKDFFEIARNHSNGALPINYKSVNQYENFQARLPERLRNIPFKQAVVQSEPTQAGYKKTLTDAEYKNLVALANKNEVFRQSLINLGYGRYGVNNGKSGKRAGVFFIAGQNEFTKGTVARLESDMYYNQLVPALESNVVNYIPIDTANDREKGKLAKRSSTTASAAYEALHVTSAMMPSGLAPFYIENGKRAAAENISIQAGRIGRPQTETYIVPSLTPKDFKEGKFPTTTTVRWNASSSNSNPEESSYVTIDSSRFTELAGMKGDRTFGNGRIGNVGTNPELLNGMPLYIVDYSNDMYKKDKFGRYIYDDNNKMVPNQEVLDEVAKFFDKSAEFEYNYKGETKKYNYPKVTRQIDGKEEHLVPVTIKGGGVYFIREDQYKAQSKHYLESVGSNIFDNYRTPGKTYTDFTEANKDFEAVNRLISGSVPFEKAGGKLPTPEETAIVDLSSVFMPNTKKSHRKAVDGAMIMMPGFIPGGDATIRHPGLNLKGVAQTFDFKAFLKDAYGIKEGDPFYLPGVNMPDDLQEIYKANGLQGIKNNAVYGRDKYEDTIKEYFVDVMRMNAIIDKSLLKSSAVKGLHGEAANEAIRERMKALSKEDSFRIIETAEAHGSHGQKSLSVQSVQNLALTSEEINANRKAWLDYIDKLQNNVETQKKEVFNTNDALDIDFRKNPSILAENSAAQTKLRERVLAADMAMRKGELFASGDLDMLMALANYGGVFSSLAAKNGYVPNGLEGQKIVAAFALRDNQIATGDSKFINSDKGVAATRYPDAPGQMQALTIRKVLSRFAQQGKYGLNKFGVYMNPWTIDTMGGGDFDGDTIQVIMGWIREVAVRTRNLRKSSVARKKDVSNAIKNVLPDQGEIAIDGNFVAQALARQIAMPVLLGGVSNAIDALSQGNWDDPTWVEQIGSSAADLARAYDIDSTYQKTGILEQFSSKMKEATKMGRPFTSIYKHLNGAVASNDFSKMPKLSTVNFPSIFSATTGLMMSAIASSPLSNEHIKKMVEAQRLEEGYSPSDLNGNSLRSKWAQFIEYSNQLKAESMISGKSVSEAERRKLLELLNAWNIQIESEQRQAKTPQKLEYVEEMQKKYYQQRLQLDALGLYGLTEANIQAKKGYYDLYKKSNNPSDFQIGLSKEELKASLTDAQKLEASAELATNPYANARVFANHTPISITKQKQIAQAKQDAKKMTYSYSMMSKFSSEDPKDREEWYRQYVEHEKTPESDSAVLGTAVHSVINEWGKRRLEVQEEQEKIAKNEITQATKKNLSGDEMVALLDDILIHPGTGKTAMWKKNEEGEMIPLVQDTKERARLIDVRANAINFLQGFNDRFANRKLIGTEELVKNNSLLPDGGKMLGFIDLLFEGLEPGTVDIFDLKNHAKGHDPRQLLLYAALVNNQNNNGNKLGAAGRLAFLGYGDGAAAKEVAVDANPEEIQKTVEWAANVYQTIQNLAAATGFNKDDLDRLTEGGRNWMSYGSVEEMLNKLDSWFTENPNSSVSKDRLANFKYGVDTYDNLTKEQKIEIDKQAAEAQNFLDIHNAYQEQLKSLEDFRNSLSSTTGTGIANAMNLQNRANSEQENMGKYIGDMNRKKYAALNETFNPWESSYSRLNNFKTIIDNLGLHGISLETSTELKNMYAKAQESYKEALSVVAPADLNEFAETYKNRRTGPQHKTPTADYQKSFEEVNTAFKTKSEAYNQLTVALDRRLNELEAAEAAERAAAEEAAENAKRSDKKGANKTHYKITNAPTTLRGVRKKEEKIQTPDISKQEDPSEIDKVKNKQKELSEAHTAAVNEKNAYVAHLRENRATLFDNDVQKLLDLTQKGQVSSGVQIAEKLNAYKTDIQDRQRQLDFEYNNPKGIMFGDRTRYEQEKAALDFLEKQGYTNYENLLNEEAAKQERNRLLDFNNQQFNGERQLRQFEMKQREFQKRNSRNQYEHQLKNRNSYIESLREYKHDFENKQTYWTDRQKEIQREYTAKDPNSEAYKQDARYQQATEMAQKYANAIGDVKKQLDNFGNAHVGVSAAMDTLSASMQAMVSRYVSMFARQLMRHVTQFVKQYDAAMTEIQVVTRKSDEEISRLGENMMQVAKDMKVGFSEVANATTELYRQGLSDDEVDERREQILKFSKISKVSATDATKLITVGLNSGLFNNAQQVTDVVTALGDGAATNAEQIQKGIQKSGYAAKQAGVTGEELAAMLTVITASTQLSGNVAGTTLRNVFSRMNRVKNGDTVVYDESGNMMTATTLASVLNSAGVNVYEDGKMKSVTQILTEIGNVWENLSDAKKNQIAYQLGGTEQYSNVSALLSGFAETDENGQTLMEKYLELAGSSEGIVDEKYADQIDSLNASLTNLTNSFDALIQSFTNADVFKRIIDVIAELINGLTFINEKAQGLPAIILAVAAALAVLNSVMNLNPVVRIISGITLLAGLVGSIWSGLSNSSDNNNNQIDYVKQWQTSSQAANERSEHTNTIVQEMTTILKKAKNDQATAADLAQYNDYAQQLNDMGYSSVEVADSLDELRNSADSAATSLQNVSDNIDNKKQAEQLSNGSNSIIAMQYEYSRDLEKERKYTQDTIPKTILAWYTDWYDGEEISKARIEETLKNWSNPQNNITPWVTKKEDGTYQFDHTLTGSRVTYYDPFLDYMTEQAYNGAYGEHKLEEDLKIKNGKQTLTIGAGTVLSADSLKDYKEKYGLEAVYTILSTPYFFGKELAHVNNIANDVLNNLGDANAIKTEDFLEKIYESYFGESSIGGFGDYVSAFLDAMYSEIPSIYNDPNYQLFKQSRIAALNEIDLNDENSGIQIRKVIHDDVTDENGFSQTKFNEIISDQTQNTENTTSSSGRFAEDIGKAAIAAATLNTDNPYGDNYRTLYNAYKNASNDPSGNRATSFIESIKEVAPLFDMIENNNELSEAFKAIYNDDNTVRENIEDTDWQQLGYAIANSDTSLAALAHRSEKQIGNTVRLAYQYIKNNPGEDSWATFGLQNQNAIDQTQKDFETILGATNVANLRNGVYANNKISMDYIDRVIANYGTGIEPYNGIEYATTAEQILQGIDSAEDVSAYLDTLPQELLNTLGSQISGFDTYMQYLRMDSEERVNKGISDSNFGKARAEFEAGIDEAKLRVIEQYNGDLEETITLLSQLKKGGKEAANAVQTLDSKISQNAYNRWALDKYKSGDRSDTVLTQLSSGFGIDQGELKEATEIDATAFISTMEQELEGQTSDLTMTTGAMLTSMWEDVKSGLPEGFDYAPYVDINGAVTDVSGFVAALNATGDAAAQAFAALVARLGNLGASFKIGLGGNGISVSLGSASATPKSSGGGGGGKSNADKLVDKIKKGQALYEHRIKMIQYKQTEYTNADELTNYGRMIEKEMEIERSYLPIVQENINKLKEQMAKTKVGSDDWYTLRDAILSAEETYEEINKTLDENKQKLEENQQAILKLHTDLEDSVTSEIQNRLQKERDMTDGAVSMQDTILNAIKQRYQDEWDLQKKDIEKKKEALEEEKSLIDERLNARKDAEDEAEKYEELSELKKQLAAVEMDSSRTKDAAALREKIAELEKEIGWDIAEKEAENAKNEIQDQIDAYDDYVTKGDEDLEELLKDANNFSEEVNNVLKMNQTELFDWLKNNVQEYTNSLLDAQQQMVNSWTDTYKQMMGITDTYWDEVAEILSSKDSYLEYMKNSDEYINASDDMKSQLEYQWADAYDKWILALKDTTNYDHFDTGLGDMSGSEYGSGTSSGSGSGSSQTSSANKTSSSSLADSLADFLKDTISSIAKNPLTAAPIVKTGSGMNQLLQLTLPNLPAFASGGIADFTGPAWVDGTASQPERVLSPHQTASFDKLVSVMDSLEASGFSLDNLRSSIMNSRIHIPSLAPAIDKTALAGVSSSIGTVNVTIEEAEINDDRDYDEIAQIVGEKFAKEISKQGVTLARYSF